MDDDENDRVMGAQLLQAIDGFRADRSRVQNEFMQKLAEAQTLNDKEKENNDGA